MKLRQWLKEYHQMSYAEFRALPDIEKQTIESNFQEFNRRNQLSKHQNRRPMTQKELIELTKVLDREKKRYETSLKIGGIDELGNYTALHHR